MKYTHRKRLVNKSRQVTMHMKSMNHYRDKIKNMNTEQVYRNGLRYESAVEKMIVTT